MIEIFSLEFLLIVLLSFIAGLTKTAFGIGAGVFLTPIASLIVLPQVAVGILAPLMIASDITTLRYNWRKWDVNQLFIVIPLSLVGIFIGAKYLSWAPTELARVSIGIVAVIFSSIQLYRILLSDSVSKKAFSFKTGIVISFVAGIASAIAHSGGLVLSFYLITLKLPISTFIATLTCWLFFNDILKIILYYKFNILTNHLVFISIFTMPALFFGSFIGSRIASVISYTQFVVVINFLIFLSGIVLIVRVIL